MGCRAYIANPDLSERLRNGWEFDELVKPTMYGGGAAGYIDNPAYAAV
ncbi:hypothetical protein [Nocardioides sp. InS609-2]|nr:hypothetical protein [Nocardioides sp. InS609-2]